MFIARVKEGQWYWCVKCRRCDTTIPVCVAERDTPPPQAIEGEIKCHSCLAASTYTLAECRRLRAQGGGAPWDRWD
jgi:hypothetical protein